MSTEPDEKYNPTRRKLLRGVGAAGAIGTAGLANSTFNITDRIGRALGLIPEYGEEAGREAGKKAGAEAGQEAVGNATESEVYIDIDDEDFVNIYGHVRDELDEDDYDHTADDSLHDAILNEDPHYKNWIDGELEDGEIVSVDIRYGAEAAVDSKLRFSIEWEDREQTLRDDIDDSAAEAFVDAMYEVVEDQKIEEEYSAETW